MPRFQTRMWPAGSVAKAGVSLLATLSMTTALDSLSCMYASRSRV